MSSNVSPSHYVEDAFVTDADFKVDINQKMKVPEKISFNNDLNGDIRNSWVRDNFDMQVPERILVVGQDKHVGTRAPPREIAFDNSLFGSTEAHPAAMPRVATPPRTLTLDRYSYPDTSDYQEEPEEDQIPVIKPKAKVQLNLNDSYYSTSPPLIGGPSGTKLLVNDELDHVRRQVAKLNRRVIALELENINRLQKEKIVLGVGIAYFLLKVIIWMNRD